MHGWIEADNEPHTDLTTIKLIQWTLNEWYKCKSKFKCNIHSLEGNKDIMWNGLWENDDDDYLFLAYRITCSHRRTQDFILWGIWDGSKICEEIKWKLTRKQSSPKLGTRLQNNFVFFALIVVSQRKFHTNHYQSKVSSSHSLLWHCEYFCPNLGTPMLASMIFFL